MVGRAATGHRLWLRRLGWLLLIWLLSVAVLGILSALLRGIMNFAGMTG
jgi:hypothetical protein